MLLMLELRHVGGALGRAKHDHGALAKLDAGFVFFVAGMAVPGDRRAGPRAARGDEGRRRRRTPTGATTATSASTRPTRASFYGKATYARLQAVKSVYDPGQMIRANHEISPAA